MVNEIKVLINSPLKLRQDLSQLPQKLRNREIIEYKLHIELLPNSIFQKQFQ